MATIYDVARECGVSITTVSLVLNKRPHTIGARTQQSVTDAAKRLNYQQAGWAKGNGKGTWKTITVLFNTVQTDIVTNPYATGILAGVFPAASHAGYQVIVMTTTWEYTKGIIPAFRDGCTQGVLLVAPPIGSTIVSGIARSNLPIVVVNATSNVRHVHSLDIDNYQVARLATEHLLELGHTKIGMLMGPLLEQSVAERRTGFLETLSGAGIVPPPEYLSAGTYDQKPFRRRARQLLTLSDPPSALFCSCDGIACAVYETAHELGISIPGHLSIVSCDDYLGSAVMTPPLTTVHHPLSEVGDTATQLLVRQIEQQDTALSESENAMVRRIPVTLTVRNSTAPPSRQLEH